MPPYRRPQLLISSGECLRGPRGHSRAFVCGLSSPVLGLHSVGRLTSGRFCRVCLGTGDFLRPQGAIPPRLIPPSGGGYCLAPEAPQKGECWRGRRVFFWHLPTRVGFGPATGPTLKTALCHIRALVGRNDKYRVSEMPVLWSGLLWATSCWDYETTPGHSKRHSHYIVYVVQPIYIFDSMFFHCCIDLIIFGVFLDYFW